MLSPEAGASSPEAGASWPEAGASSPEVGASSPDGLVTRGWPRNDEDGLATRRVASRSKPVEAEFCCPHDPPAAGMDPP